MHMLKLRPVVRVAGVNGKSAGGDVEQARLFNKHPAEEGGTVSENVSVGVNVIAIARRDKSEVGTFVADPVAEHILDCSGEG